MHDSSGNLTTKTEGGRTWTYEWDAENRLVRVTLDDAEVARFEYDPLGRRIRKVAEGVIHSYLYDGVDIVREARSDGTLYTFVHGPGIDEPLARIDQTGSVSFYPPDQRLRAFTGAVSAPAT